VVNTTKKDPYDRLYKKFSPTSWTELKHVNDSLMSERELDDLLGIGVSMDLEEVRDIYLPIAELIVINIKRSQELNKEVHAFFKSEESNLPYIIGVAGSVAVGKSTFSRILQVLISRLSDFGAVDLVTTDGFLYPNKTLEKKDLMERKGFPESFNVRALFDFLSEIKSGKDRVRAPVYSHLTYDIVENEEIVIDNPDILILEGINVLQPPRIKDNIIEPIISDFFDFSIYLDAEEPHIRKWYIERFLELRSTAFNQEGAFFNRFANLKDEEAVDVANSIWEEINLKNLEENILPTRNRASLIAKKGKDHNINELWIRKI
jgi:type I pantothenate kinase